MRQWLEQQAAGIPLRRTIASAFFLLMFAASAQAASVSLTPGWATFGQVLPQGQARSGLQVGSLPTQTDIKNLWPDGSIKFAVVTANIPSAGTYPITGGSNSGSFSPTVPTASVQFTIGGTVYTAALPSAVSSDLWLNGPLVKEWRQVVTPMNGSTPHPLLRVYFDTRVYNDGKARVDVDVENTFDVSGATDVTYDVNIRVNGQVVLSSSSITHWYMARWRKTFQTNGLAEAEAYQDFTSYVQAGAVPQYDPSLVQNGSWPLDGTYLVGSTTYYDFGILGKGSVYSAYMWDPGGRVEIALYPEWIAQYLIYKTKNQRDATILTGNLAGSWSVHLREEGDGNMLSLDAHPNFWLDGRCEGNCPRAIVVDPITHERKLILNNPLSAFNNPHTPSLAYVPYLMTGDRYFADEMKFWANATMMDVNPNSGPGFADERGGASGHDDIIMAEAPRGIAWGLRNIVDAAAYIPDSDSFKSYFVTKANNNLVAMDKFSKGLMTRSGQRVSPYGTTFEYYGPCDSTSTVGLVSQPQWQNNYVAWVLDHALAQGFTSGAATRDRIVRFQLRLFTSGPGYPIGYAAPYYPMTGRYRSICANVDDPIDWFTNLTDLYNWNIAPGNNGAFGTLNQFAGYYGTDARIALIIAIKLGLPGAQTAYDWLMPKLGADDLSGRWAIARVGSSGPPSGSGILTLNLPAFLARNGQVGATYTGSTPAATFAWSFTPSSEGRAPRPEVGASSALGARASGLAPSASFTTSSPQANLSLYSLGLGLYQVNVEAFDSANNSLGTASGSVTLVPGDLSGVRVYPNPWRSDRHSVRQITFDQLTVNSTVKIFTVSGHWVKTLPTSSTSVTWDLTNDSGDRVASGVYMYLITADQGQKKTGQVVVIK